MKKRYNVFALLLFFVAIAFRLIMFWMSESVALNLGYYVVVLFGILMLGFESFGQKEYAPAFVFENNFHLDIFSAIAGIGFFADFVYDAVSIYISVTDGSYAVLTSFIPLCFSLLLSFASGFYFFMIAISFSSSTYDFRQFKIFHIVPLLWAISKILGVLTNIVSFTKDIDTVSKYVVLVFMVCAFYHLAMEVDSTLGARRSTVFCYRGLYFTGILYFINQLMLVLSSNAQFLSEDTVFSLTALCICSFMYFSEKNIIYHCGFEV